MLGHRAMNVNDYWNIFRRRIWAFVIPIVVVPMAAILVASILPKSYTATTTVLVGQGRIQQTVAPPVNPDEMSQRLATIQQQILSRPNMESIIDRYGLFAKDRATVPIEDLEDDLTKQIVIAPIDSLQGTNYKGLPGFSVTVTANGAELAQKICADLTNMFIQQNVTQRRGGADATSQFLDQQLADAKASLDAQDARLAQFKERYVGQMPEETQTNLTMLQSLSTQLSAATADLNRAQQDRAFTQTLLDQQIAAMQTTTDNATDIDTLQKELADAEARLADLQSKYTDDHPDVKKAKHDVQVLKDEINAANQNAQANSVPKTPAVQTLTSPQIQQLRAQVHQYDETIKEKTIEQKRLQDQIQTYQARVNMSPVVEQEYKEITRDSQNASDFYNKLLTEKSQSSVVTGLVNDEGSDEFQVLDPPEVPQRPSFPKRSIFAAGGLAGGLALGVGLVVFLEMNDKSLRCEQDVEVLLRIPMLTHMPLIDMGPGKSFQRGSSVPKGNEINLRA
jgi:polysaccharide chain length determinant protein (PEP-CTERM system associated)